MCSRGSHKWSHNSYVGARSEQIQSEDLYRKRWRLFERPEGSPTRSQNCDARKVVGVFAGLRMHQFQAESHSSTVFSRYLGHAGSTKRSQPPHFLHSTHWWFVAITWQYYLSSAEGVRPSPTSLFSTVQELVLFFALLFTSIRLVPIVALFYILIIYSVLRLPRALYCLCRDICPREFLITFR